MVLRFISPVASIQCEGHIHLHVPHLPSPAQCFLFPEKTQRWHQSFQEAIWHPTGWLSSHACRDPCPCHILLGFFSMRTVTSRRAMTAIYLWPQSQAQCQARVNTSSQWLRTWRITAEGLLWQGAAGEVTGKDESGVGKIESRNGGITGNKMSVSFPGNVRVCTGWPSQHVMWGI